MQIREATHQDLAAIAEIENHERANGTANWGIEPESLEQWAEKLATSQAAGLPILVVEEAGVVLGYGSFRQFRPHEAWSPSAEHWLYLHQDARGRGLGGALLDALLERIAQAGYRNTIACVESGNAGSIRLHEGRGFEEVGRFSNVGEKFGRSLSVVFLRKRL